MHIPAVTLDDLRAFQSNHFEGGSSQTPLGAPLECSQIVEPTSALEDYEEDDGDELGYYADGVKRTLTNEQVAMFRHSEIYSILRQRQIAREQEQMDEETSRAQHELVNASASTSQSRPHQRETVPKMGEVHVAAAKSNTGQNDDRTKSTRRVTRELDNAVATDEILDYGEEDTSTQRRSQTEKLANSRPDGSTDLQSRTEGRKIWWPTIGK